MPNSNRPTLIFLANQFGIKSEVWMYRQATLMQQSDVRVLCRQHRNPELYPSLPGTEILEIPKAVWLHPLFRAFGKGLGTRLVVATINRWQNRRLGRYPGTRQEAEWIRNVLEQRQPAACLMQYGTTGVKYAKLLHALKYPYAIHFHGFDLSSAVRSPTYAKNIIWAADHAFALIVVAGYMRDWLVQHGVPSERVHIVPYGVPMDEFKPIERDRSGKLTFLMVGRLTEKKAPELCLRAFAECRKACPDVTLKILGDGELLDQCKRQVIELNLNDDVTFLGAQPSHVVREEMQKADVFLQHSRVSSSGDKEGWPVAIAEAAGSGLPVVSTRHASIPEQIVDGESGLLCDEGDWETMATNMIRLATDRELIQAMGQYAREFIGQWDNSQQIRKLEQLLLETPKSLT